MRLFASHSDRTTRVRALVLVLSISATFVAVGTSPGGATATRGAITLSPSDGPTRGGTVVTITGSGLRAAKSVSFGRLKTRFTVIGNDELHAVAPAGSGTVGVRVSETSARLFAGAFRYLSTPTVGSIAPDKARVGTRVLVRGTGFIAGTKVLIGAQAARSVEVRNPRALIAVVPPGFGTLNVRVVTPGGTSHASAATRFTFQSTVLVVGDSLGIDLGWGFTSDSNLIVTDDSVGSSGLVRQDFYNWPAHLRADLRAVKPTVVIALFGANDNQPIQTSHGTAAVGTAAWSAAYEGRVRQLRSIASASGAYLAWIGLPRVGPTSDVPSTFVARVLRLARAAMRGDARGSFVSTASLFTTSTGSYTPLVYLAHHVVEVGHQPDGLHLTPAGATAVDGLAIQAVTRRLGATAR